MVQEGIHSTAYIDGILLQHVLYYIILCYIIVYYIISYHIISYHILSYHIISCHIRYIRGLVQKKPGWRTNQMTWMTGILRDHLIENPFQLMRWFVGEILAMVISWGLSFRLSIIQG